MKTSIKRSLQGLMLVPVLALGLGVVAPVLQQDVVFAQGGAAPGGSAGVSDGGIRGGMNAAKGDDQVDADANTLIQNVVNTLLFIIGAVAVIMLIFGGFRYVTSGGDSNAVTSAKNTILYAVIGIIVAVLAYAIVNWLLGQLGVT